MLLVFQGQLIRQNAPPQTTSDDLEIAILNALNLVDQINGSISNFEDELSCTKKTITWKRTEQFFKIVDTNLPENFTSVWMRAIMCQLNQRFNLPPWATPRAFEFFENYCSNSSLPKPNTVQMPHTTCPFR